MSKLPAIAPVAKPPTGKSSSMARRRTDARVFPVLRSGRRAFDDWVELGARLARYYAELIAALEQLNEKESSAAIRAAEDLLFRWTPDELADATARFLRGRSWFERDGVYEPDGSVSAEFVAEAVGTMLTGITGGAAANAEAYVGLLVEELIATGASATQIEFATRQVGRGRTFLPALAEVLKALAEAQTPEDDGAFFEDEDLPLIMWGHHALAKMLAHLKGPPRLPPGGAR
jgi:hypothetical protein